jgi:hypothetical protein
MQTRQDVLRGRIDSLRVAVNASEIDREHALAMLQASLAVATTDHSIDPDRHPGAIVYMCPWHTCAGTRHSPN